MQDPDAIYCSGRLSTSLVNNTAKSVKVTVGAQEMWVIRALDMVNGDDVNRNLRLSIIDASDNEVQRVGYKATVAQNGHAVAPNGEGGMNVSHPVPVLAGYKIEFYWAAGGASAGGTAYYSYTVERYFVR